MQAIQTKLIPPTNSRGMRIKATCSRGSCMFRVEYDTQGNTNHEAAAHWLCASFINDDLATYGTPVEKNPWARQRVCGQLKDGSYVHVFVS